MPQARIRYRRPSKRSKYRTPRRRSGSTVWTVAIVALVILGVGAVFLARSDTTSSTANDVPPKYADSTNNVAGDHWHTALQVDICGEWLPAQPLFEKPVSDPNAVFNAGIHTHGDYLIHTHPFQASEAGNHATLGKFAGYAGWSVSSTSIDTWAGPSSRPNQKSWANGDTCPFGQYKGQKGVLTWAVDGKPQTGNPSSWKLVNGATLAIYFLPKGAEQPFPPNACSALANITDNAQALITKGSPCQAQLGTTTTTAPAAAPTTTKP